jgi:serine/threonine protein kinase/tetratricopeptide (TPR) repeat protein
VNATFQRVKELFLACLERESPGEREALLGEACRADEVLRRQVEALLRQHEQAGSFLEKPPAGEAGEGETGVAAPGRWTDPVEPALPSEGPGSRIGPYKLLQRLGEGGMGAVFLAEQEEPVKRRVAVKIIKPGMDSAHVLARFEAERQALAMMDHPHIARVLDAGATDRGRPYFVMELVKGITITKFCDQEQLTPKDRLELFIPVCQAVQHAHQKGVIHRDLKPSNVLIALYDGKPVPKVIDFGVAKATAQKLTERTLFTEVGQVVGTLEYMAPEQAELNNLDIDTRADVYSLGVLLYELLTGSPPFTAQELRSAAFTETLRIIREVEPPKPSTRLSSSEELPAIAAKRKLEPAKLARLLRGDLDWIVMKCLEKDRGRRYDTANGLAMDVQRYLADEPVLASPPSVRYRLGKFVRKHRGPVLAASVILVLLVGGIIGTSLGIVRAEWLRQIAEENRQTALDEKANALAAAAAERLAKQNEAAQRKKAEASLLQAMEALRATTDDVVEHLIGAKPALGPAEKAFLENTLKRWQAFATEQGGGEPARQVRGEGVFRVASLRHHLGEHDAALAGYREASVLWGKLAADIPAVHYYRQILARSHNDQGVVLAELGKRAQAEDAYRQALTILEKLAADFPAEPQYRRDLALSHNNLGNLLADLGKPDEAMAAHRQALDIQEKLAAESPAVAQYRSDLARSHNNLGIRLRRLGKPAEAEAAYRQALGIRKKLVVDFPDVPQYRGELARSHNDLGILLKNLGKRAEAEAAYRQALTIQDNLASDFPAVPRYRIDLGGSQVNFGHLLRANQQPEQALEWYAKAIANLESVVRQVKVDATAQLYLRNAHWERAMALDDLKRHAQAAAAWDKVVELSPEPQRPEMRMNRALSRVRLGQVDTATQEAEELTKNANANTLYDAACVFAVAAARPDESGGSLLKEECAKRAVALLQQAIAKGWMNVELMKKDDDLQALRERDDFKKLLVELEKKSP